MKIIYKINNIINNKMNCYEYFIFNNLIKKIFNFKESIISEKII